MTERRAGRGFVMLTILWIMSVAAVVAMAAALAARHAVVEGSSRVWLERARWEALGCARRSMAAIDRLLQQARSADDAAAAWRTLPRHLERSSLEECGLELEAAGTRLDVNAATEEMLDRVFAAVGLEARATELVDALEDWIDADDDARAFGAERVAYEAAGRIVPRNDSLADTRELHRVVGFEQLQELDSVLTTEPGRVSLATAPVSVLMAVPGITRETAEQIVAMQRNDTPLEDLLDVTRLISPASAAALQLRYADAQRITTANPDAWLVRVHVARGTPAVAVQLEWRIIRTGHRCAVAGTRSSI